MTYPCERATGTIDMIIEVFLYIITLGFAHKYQKRLRLYESLDSDDGAKNAALSRSADSSGVLGRDGSAGAEIANYPLGQKQDSKLHASSEGVWIGNPSRSRQGAEWDKLSTASSVITATSATALAIPGLAGTNAYWMVNACFCAALGLSLEGLILVNYMNVIARGVSDQTIGTLAKGKLRAFGLVGIPARLPALMMALPMIFSTYSSLYLLAGTVIMIIKSPQGATEPLPNPYYWLPLVPIGFGFTCMCGAVLVCEAGTYGDVGARRRPSDLEAAVSGTATPAQTATVTPSQGPFGPGYAMRSRPQHERAFTR